MRVLGVFKFSLWVWRMVGRRKTHSPHSPHLFKSVNMFYHLLRYIVPGSKSQTLFLCCGLLGDCLGSRLSMMRVVPQCQADLQTVSVLPSSFALLLAPL